MFKKIIASFLILSCSLFVGTPVFAATSQQIINTTRLSGQTRYETAKAISEYYNQGKVKNVILSTGNEFADALSASVLAHQKNAPILLVDTSIDGSKDAFDYVTQHLDSTGTIYIIGGTGIIGKEFEDKLNALGFNNIVRIAGYDRYQTSYQLASALNSSSVSTLVISSGESYSDALSIASFAANKGWPILLTPQASLPQEMKDYLLEKQPTKVYITGGTGVISDNVKSEISSLLPRASVERLAGQDRFDTNATIAQTFNPNPSTIYLATGYGFADALAGSALAAKTGDPIILVDPSLSTLPSSVSSYLKSFHGLGISVTVFGGSGAVPDSVENSIKNLLNLTSQSISIVTPTINGEASNVVNKVANNLIVRTGVNMDLLYIATETGGNFQNPQGYLLNQDAFGLNAAVKSYFGKYVSNENAKELYNQAMQVPNPPHKFVGSELTDVLQSDEGNLMQPLDRTTWETVSKFESDTKATDFFTENRKSYEQMVQDFVKTNLNFNHVLRLQNFFGKDLSKNKFEIVLSTVENGGQATWLDNTDGTKTYIIIINPSDNSGILNVLYHETAHNFYDVRTEDPDLVNEYAQYANALGHHEADFGTELNETIARVVTLVMIDKYHGKEAAIENLNLVTQDGWKNTKEIATLVQNNYMNNRNQYKTFKDFMPVIFEYLKASSLQQPFDIGPSQF